MLFNNPEQAENLKQSVLLHNDIDESLNDSSPKTPSGCEVKRLSVHGGCLGSQRR